MVIPLSLPLSGRSGRPRVPNTPPSSSRNPQLPRLSPRRTYRNPSPVGPEFRTDNDTVTRTRTRETRRQSTTDLLTVESRRHTVLPWLSS